MLLTSKSNIVKMHRGLDRLNLSADVELLGFVAEVCNRRVCRIVSPKDLDSFLNLVRLIDIVD